MENRKKNATTYAVVFGIAAVALVILVSAFALPIIATATGCIMDVLPKPVIAGVVAVFIIILMLPGKKK